jgi:hypothetical protein
MSRDRVIPSRMIEYSINSGFGRVAFHDPKAPAVRRKLAAGFAQRSAAPKKAKSRGR